MRIRAYVLPAYKPDAPYRFTTGSPGTSDEAAAAHTVSDRLTAIWL